MPIEDMGALGARIEADAGHAARRRGPVQHLAARPPAHPRADPRPSHHADLLQQPPARRAARRAPQRARRRGAGEGPPRVARREQRLLVEDELKTGRLRALVATSSLELGIDMGTVDLVIQVESPGRGEPGPAAHRPRRPPGRRAEHRQDLPEVPRRPARGRGRRRAHAVGRDRVDPHRPQPARRARPADRRDVRGRRVGRRRPRRRRPPARPTSPSSATTRSPRCSTCSRAATRRTSSPGCGPRIVWDRLRGTVRARDGAGRIAITNGGTIPDRGLFGVFLPEGTRVGELDEEMVYESRPGETFVLGASTWRIDQITHDRVIVLPAPGEPGQMPFWHGDQPGPADRARPRHRRVHARPARPGPPTTRSRTCGRETALDELAARNLVAYLDEQVEATGAIPDDRTIVVERFPDELGDWRVCVLTPFGARVHAPWGMALRARARASGSASTCRCSGATTASCCACPTRSSTSRSRTSSSTPSAVEDLVVDALPGSSLFGARFREAAARALLLPKRRPGERTPLWQQRQKAAGLLEVAAGHPSFPIILETTRECLQDVFDLPALIERAARPAVPQGPDGHRRHAEGVTVRRSRSSTRGSPPSCTRATRRSPSGGPRRSRSTATCCASCSAPRSCASCSTPTRSAELELELQRLTPAMQERIRSADDVVDLLARPRRPERGRARGTRARSGASALARRPAARRGGSIDDRGRRRDRG